MSNVLVKRLGAMGDVVNITPVVRRLARQGHQVSVFTQHPYIFAKNTDCLEAGTHLYPENFDQVFDLTGAYEQRRTTHHIRAYMKAVFGDDGEGHDLSTFVAPTLLQTHFDAKGTIVIHPTVSWPNRTLPVDWWEELVRRINALGFPTVQVGTLQDHTLGRVYFDTRGKLTLSQQLSLIAAARCFVGGESGLATAAGATDTPIVNLYALTRGEYWLPFRHGEMGWNFHSITPQIECFGCAARQGAVEYFDCERGDRKCLTLFDPALVAQTVVDAIANDRRKELPHGHR